MPFTVRYTKVKDGRCKSVSLSDCKEIAKIMKKSFDSFANSESKYPAGCYEKVGGDVWFNENKDMSDHSCSNSRVCLCDSSK